MLAGRTERLPAPSKMVVTQAIRAVWWPTFAAGLSEVDDVATLTFRGGDSPSGNVVLPVVVDVVVAVAVVVSHPRRLILV